MAVLVLWRRKGKLALLGGNMGVKDHEAEVVAKLKAYPGYRQQFQAVFKGEPMIDNSLCRRLRLCTKNHHCWQRRDRL
jgi:hypothetical protein